MSTPEWSWSNKIAFIDLYPTSEAFIEYIEDITEVTPLMDLESLYTAMVRSYGFDKLKHTARVGFEYDMYKIWNSNIHMWNKIYELLSQDYAYEMGKKRSADETVDEVTDRDQSDDIGVNASGTADQTSYEKPQFNQLEQSPTNKVAGNTTDTQTTTSAIAEDVVRNLVRNNLNKDQEINENVQINQYLEIYNRFRYSDMALMFEDMFVNLLY